MLAASTSQAAKLRAQPAQHSNNNPRCASRRATMAAAGWGWCAANSHHHKRVGRRWRRWPQPRRRLATFLSRRVPRASERDTTAANACAPASPNRNNVRDVGPRFPHATISHLADKWRVSQLRTQPGMRRFVAASGKWRSTCAPCVPHQAPRRTCGKLRKTFGAKSRSALTRKAVTDLADVASGTSRRTTCRMSPGQRGRQTPPKVDRHKVRGGRRRPLSPGPTAMGRPRRGRRPTRTADNVSRCLTMAGICGKRRGSSPAPCAIRCFLLCVLRRSSSPCLSPLAGCTSFSWFESWLVLECPPGTRLLRPRRNRIFRSPSTFQLDRRLPS